MGVNKMRKLRDELVADINRPEGRWGMHGHSCVDDWYFTALHYVVDRMDEALAQQPVAAPSARESVARAICAACDENPDHKGDAQGNEYRWQDYLPCADAAISAMPPVAVELTDAEIFEAYESEQQGRWGDHIRSLRAVIAANEAKKGAAP